jgi:DNA transformation protein
MSGRVARAVAAPTAVSDLGGLGPKSQAMLEAAGIRTLAQLRRLGAVPAFARVRAHAAGHPEAMRPSLNLLWALEGALSGLPWQQVAREHRLSLTLALEAHEARTARTPPTARPDGARQRRA